MLLIVIDYGRNRKLFGKLSLFIASKRDLYRIFTTMVFHEYELHGYRMTVNKVFMILCL